MQVAVDLPSNAGEAPVDVAEQRGIHTLESFFTGDILARQRENLATSADSEASGELSKKTCDVVIRSVEGASTESTITRVRLAVTVSSALVVSGDTTSDKSAASIDKFVTADVVTDADGSKKVSSLTYETPQLPGE